MKKTIFKEILIPPVICSHLFYTSDWRWLKVRSLGVVPQQARIKHFLVYLSETCHAHTINNVDVFERI